MATNRQRQAVLEQEITEQFEIFERYSFIQSGFIENEDNIEPEFIEETILKTQAEIEMLCFALRMFVKKVDKKHPWAYLFDWHSKGKKAIAIVEIAAGNEHYKAFL